MSPTIVYVGVALYTLVCFAIGLWGFRQIQASDHGGFLPGRPDPGTLFCLVRHLVDPVQRLLLHRPPWRLLPHRGVLLRHQRQHRAQRRVHVLHRQPHVGGGQEVRFHQRHGPLCRALPLQCRLHHRHDHQRGISAALPGPADPRCRPHPAGRDQGHDLVRNRPDLYHLGGAPVRGSRRLPVRHLQRRGPGHHHARRDAGGDLDHRGKGGRRFRGVSSPKPRPSIRR